jgi:hypothetical protein
MEEGISDLIQKRTGVRVIGDDMRTTLVRELDGFPIALGKDDGMYGGYISGKPTRQRSK